MAEKQYVAIGYTKKTHGVAGELKVAVEAQFLEDFLKSGTVFIETRGKKVPFFIQNVRGGGPEPIVKFEDVETREAAQLLSSKEIFLRDSDILPDDERELEVPEDSGMSFCKGFTLLDQTAGDLGKIVAIVSVPGQEMAVINRSGRELFVPLIPAFLKKVDKRGRRVLVDLPDGLLDL